MSLSPLTSSPSNGHSRIPTPWPVRWRRFRQRVLPTVMFLSLSSVVLWMWQQDISSPHALGEVEAIRAIVSSGSDGLLAAPHDGRRWELFDRVEQGQVIARLDDRLLSLQLVTQRSELERLKCEVDAAAAKLTLDFFNQQRDYLHETIRLAWKREQRRILVLEKQVQLAADRVLVQRLAAVAERTERLFRESSPRLRAASELDAISARLAHDEVAQRIAANEKTLVEEQRQVELAADGFDDFPKLTLPEVIPLLAPLRAAITTQASRIAEVQQQIDGLQIRSPIGGQVAAIHTLPGQRIKLGDPVLTLASDSRRYIVSYLRSDQALRPQAGDEVRVRLRGGMSSPADSTVEYVGPQFELIPPQQLRDPRIAEWGLPVRISLPENLRPRPGELVELVFSQSHRDRVSGR